MNNIDRLRDSLERNANNMELRAVLADALEEAGRAFEATRLRQSVIKVIYLRRRRSPIHRRRLRGWEYRGRLSGIVGSRIRHGVDRRSGLTWHNDEAFLILCGVWREPKDIRSTTFNMQILSDHGALVRIPRNIVRDSS